MTDEDLPSLRSEIEAYGLWAKKSLGQNFILDSNLLHKIARHAGDLSNKTVIEIGGGPGGLTRALLQKAKRVITIEKDSRALALLKNLQSKRPTLDVIEGDALAINIHSLCPPPYAIVANLPYNIATPLMAGWLIRGDTPFTVLVQKEVAERLTAPVGSPHYGRLSILAAWRMGVEKCFDIPKEAFTPPPKITSTLIHAESTNTLPTCNAETLQHLTALCFNNRRKMLRAILKNHPAERSAAEALSLDLTARPETLPPETYYAWAKILSS